MLTLQELKQIVAVPGDKEKLLSARQLRKTGLVVVREQFGEEAEISVYRNGSVLYRVGNHSTVFLLHLCRDYIYISDGNEIHLPEQLFFNERWYLRLVLEGEDRLNRNHEERERSWKVSYSAVSEEWATMKDFADTAIEHLVRQETVEEMLRMLTEKQKTVICRYYMQEKTQTQIAEELGISRLAVRASLIQAVSKIRKKYSVYDLKSDYGMTCSEVAR